VWLIGVVVRLRAADQGSNCSLTWAMDGCIVHRSIISSCQSAATSVSSASVCDSYKKGYGRHQTFTFPPFPDTQTRCGFILPTTARKPVHNTVCVAMPFQYKTNSPVLSIND